MFTQIAVRRVVQTIGRAHVADDRRARVHADPSDAERDAVAVVRFAKALAVAVPCECTRHCASRVVGLLQGCTEEHRDSVADDAIDGSAVLERDAQHAVEIALQQAERALGR